MAIKQADKRGLNRRQFIRVGATATAGLLLAACGGNPPIEEVAPAEVAAQEQAAATPVPPTATTAVDTSTPAAAAVAEVAAAEEAAVVAEAVAAAPEESTVAPAATLIDDMTQAANRFLETLNAGQRDKAMYAFSNDERFRWHWTTPGGFPRNGLPVREMSDAQKGLAYDLLQASLSSMGFEKAINIISLQVDLGNDPELYFVTFFGTPGGPDPWGWRWEGHHLSRQFTVVGDQLVMLPFFLGSWPTTSQKGLRAMAHEEDAALELINSLTGEARQATIFQDRTLTSHVTQNAVRVSPLDPTGISYGNLAAAQQQLVTEITQAYLGTLPEPIAAPTLARIEAAGWEQVRFGWAGSLDRQRPQYFRLQGPTFLLEYDNSRNGGTHIHSVWRDFEQDFGYHLL